MIYIVRHQAIQSWFSSVLLKRKNDWATCFFLGRKFDYDDFFFFFLLRVKRNQRKINQIKTAQRLNHHNLHEVHYCFVFFPSVVCNLHSTACTVYFWYIYIYRYMLIECMLSKSSLISFMHGTEIIHNFIYVYDVPRYIEFPCIIGKLVRMIRILKLLFEFRNDFTEWKIRKMLRAESLLEKFCDLQSSQEQIVLQSCLLIYITLWKCSQ